MNSWNALTIHSNNDIGYRCRACGHVSELASDHEVPAPRGRRCAGCGLAIPVPSDCVGLAQVERHFEPLIWWDELAA